MKGFRIMLISVGLIITLSACAAAENPMPPEGYGPVNFNNTIPLRPDFYFFDEGCFYELDGFYNMGVYRSRGGKPEKLFEENDFPGHLTDFLVCGRELYFVMSDEERSTLYRYDLQTDTAESLYPMGYPDYLGVLGDQVVYQEWDGEKNLLRVLDLKTGEDRIVMEGLSIFGLVNGEIRCVVPGAGYEIFRVDPVTGQSEQLGAFSLDRKGSYAQYTFASDHVLLRFLSSGIFWSCSLSDGTVKSYTLPKDIHEMVAGENAVFLLVYDSRRNASTAVPSPENGIYRVDLTDGSCEQIYDDIDDQTKIYVESDEYIYVKNRNTVYRLDLAEGSCERAFELKRVFWD